MPKEIDYKGVVVSFGHFFCLRRRKEIKRMIQEYLKNKKLIADGSFGTYYSYKYASSEMPELANTLNPDRVVTIHREYMEAGAELIRTNTFASNMESLNMDFPKVRENIIAAVECARRAAAIAGKDQVFIAGDIGPIPAGGFLDQEALQQEYCHIVDVFLEQGLDIILFETFAELEVILPAVRHAKEKGAFVMTTFAINQFGYSTLGHSGKGLIKEAAKCPAIDALGFNCGVSPVHMCTLLGKIPMPVDKFFMTLPNAGYPKLSRNQLSYGSNPDYFAEAMTEIRNMGSDILGGCCGTNPLFISRLSQSMKLTQEKKPVDKTVAAAGQQPVIKKGFLYDQDGKRKDKKLIAVELAPPFDADDEKLLESAHYLTNFDVDVLTFPDSPSGRTRVDSVLMAAKIHKETNMAVMPHICCRDKNAVAMRSLFLGADINDIHDALIITGDPLPSMARQTVKAVFNFDSTGLMSIVKEMNEDIFTGGNMCYGGAINQGRRNLEVEISRVKKKMECGAEFFLTQPVCSMEDVDRLKRIKEETGATILCGIMPFVSRKNALFMKNEISGVNVTDQLVERYPVDGTKEEGEAVAVAFARDMIKATEAFADGYYFSFPFNRVYLLEKIMNCPKSY